ncbi:hypothetical protein CR513_39113, partial [Mucuna pruriens]
MRRPPRTLTSTPMTYIELLPRLLEQKLVEIVPLKTLEPSYPRSYDLNARSCHLKVLELETQGPRPSRWWFARFPRPGPNVQSNPLPAHKGAAVNAISHENEEKAEGPNRRGGGDPRSSKVVVMAAKVLINNSFQPDKGLGKELDGLVESVAL